MALEGMSMPEDAAVSADTVDPVGPEDDKPEEACPLDIRRVAEETAKAPAIARPARLRNPFRLVVVVVVSRYMRCKNVF
jgi:hypothetical protein